MKATNLTLGLAFLTGAFALSALAEDNELTAAEKQDGWVLLFDGKSLDGWTGDPSVWRVENGYISGKADKVAHNTFLIYKQAYSNFVLQADVMLIKNAGGFANSGIQYRSKVVNPAEWIVHGYQADMADGYWGILYEEGGRGILWKAAPEVGPTIKAADWNHYEITANGTLVREALNGVTSGELDDKDEAKRSAAGIIGLQYHAPGNGFEVRFRNIKIKLLK